MKLRFLIVTTVITLAMTTTAFAKKKDENFTREEIEQEFYTQYWKDSAVGTENPEGSLEWHILQQFLDEQYPHRQSEGKQYVVADWKDDYYIDQAWRDYHEEYMKGWDLQDDDGKMVIWEEDPETGENIRPLYTFKLLDGMWNLIDSNGNVYDTFEPHGGDGSWQELQEEDHDEEFEDLFKQMGEAGDKNTNSKTNVDPEELQEAEEPPMVDVKGVGAVPAEPQQELNDQPVSADDNSGARVTGKKGTSVANKPMVDDEITETKNTNEKEEKNSSILWILLIVIIIIAALSFIYFRKAGSKNDNKK